MRRLTGRSISKISKLLITLMLSASMGAFFYTSVSADPLNTYSGTLRDSSGNVLRGVGIDLVPTSGNTAHACTDSSGNFSIAALPDTYRLQIIKNACGPGYNLPLEDINLLGLNKTIDLTAGSLTGQDVRLHISKITVTVKDQNNIPVSGARVAAYAVAGTTASTLSGPNDLKINTSRSANNVFTNSSGTADIYTVTGSLFEAPSATQEFRNVCAAMPGSGSLVCLTSPMTVTADTTINFTKPPSFTYAGTVKNKTGSALGNMRVYLVPSSGSTASTCADSAGNFSMEVPAKTYRLQIANHCSSVPGLPLEEVNLLGLSESINLTSSSLTGQDLRVHTSKITVSVRDQNNNLVVGARVAAYAVAGTTPSALSGPSDMRISTSRSANNIFTNSAGNADIYTVTGSHFEAPSATQEFRNVCAAMPGSGQLVCLTAPTTVSVDTSFTFINPATFTYSGSLKDDDGNALPGVGIDLVPTTGNIVHACTNSTGNFSVAAAQDTYSLRILKNNCGPGYNLPLEDINLESASKIIDLRTNNVANQALVLNLSKITVTLKDGNNDPVAGARAAAYATAGTTAFTASGPSNMNIHTSRGLNNIFTGSNGTADLYTVTGSVFEAPNPVQEFKNICVALPNGGQLICLDSPRTISSDTTIELSYDDTAPIISHTIIPAPNANGWNSTNVTVSFTCSDVGSGIADCPDDVTFTTEGAGQTVTGTATDNKGNTASTTATVNIDKTDPAISYVVSPAPNANGWHNTNATVTFNCSDATSGIQSCSSPVLVSTEGATQTVTGTAVDKAGNSKSVTATIKLDKTNPVASNLTVNPNPAVTVLNPNINIAADIFDGLSGIHEAEFYIDIDPGVGNGTPMTLSAAQATAISNVAGLSTGSHTVYVRIMDKADNWSAPISRNFLKVGPPL